MPETTWTAADRYITDQLGQSDGALHAALADSADPGVRDMCRFMEMIAAEPRVSATAIQTVGSKGYDGFAVVLVTGEAGPAP
jgi:hypothetical protein